MGMETIRPADLRHKRIIPKQAGRQQEQQRRADGNGQVDQGALTCDFFLCLFVFHNHFSLDRQSGR